MVVKYYNTGEVEVLEQRLKQTKVPKRIVTKTGGKISAETDFGDSVQTSTSAPPLPGTSKGKKKEDLNESPSRAKNKGKSLAKQNDDVVSKSGKTVPSSSKPKKSQNYDYDEYEEDLMEDGMFDGMDNDDAAALCEYFILLKYMF